MKEISLSKGMVALVDDSLFEYLNQFKWTYNGNGYATRYESLKGSDSKKRKIIYMHRFVYELVGMPIPEGFVVDHIDRNPLNNQSSNLRIVTPQYNRINIKVNNKNTSGFPGVRCCKGRYTARIQIAGKRLHLGSFDTFEEACEVYSVKKKEQWGLTMPTENVDDNNGDIEAFCRWLDSNFCTLITDHPDLGGHSELHGGVISAIDAYRDFYKHSKNELEKTWKTA